jgi:hypothetical protein
VGVNLPWRLPSASVTSGSFYFILNQNQRIVHSMYLKKKQNKEPQKVSGIWKEENQSIKEPTSCSYFKTLTEPPGFMQEHITFRAVI